MSHTTRYMCSITVYNKKTIDKTQGSVRDPKKKSVVEGLIKDVVLRSCRFHRERWEPPKPVCVCAVPYMTLDENI